jgi:hypothetical protein
MPFKEFFYGCDPTYRLYPEYLFQMEISNSLTISHFGNGWKSLLVIIFLMDGVQAWYVKMPII